MAFLLHTDSAIKTRQKNISVTETIDTINEPKNQKKKESTTHEKLDDLKTKLIRARSLFFLLTNVPFSLSSTF